MLKSNSLIQTEPDQLYWETMTGYALRNSNNHLTDLKESVEKHCILTL